MWGCSTRFQDEKLTFEIWYTMGPLINFAQREYAKMRSPEIGWACASVRNNAPPVAQGWKRRGPCVHPRASGTIADRGLCCRLGGPAPLLSCVDVWSSSDRWQGHTAISVTFASDVQYVLFPPDDRREPAAVHPSARSPPYSKSSPSSVRNFHKK